MSRVRVCGVPGCPELTAGPGRCDEHRREARRVRYRDPSGSNYDSAAWKRTRATLLRTHPICTLCRQATSTVADHYPDARRDLVALGVPDPDALHRLRALCARCHNSETAKHQPGGWAAG